MLSALGLWDLADGLDNADFRAAVALLAQDLPGALAVGQLAGDLVEHGLVGRAYRVNDHLSVVALVHNVPE